MTLWSRRIGRTDAFPESVPQRRCPAHESDEWLWENRRRILCRDGPLCVARVDWE